MDKLLGFFCLGAASLPIIKRILKHYEQDETSYERVILLAMLVVTIASNGAVLGLSMDIQRTRVQTSVIYMWKPIFARIGVRLQIIRVYSCCSFVVECIFCWLCTLKYGDQYPPGFWVCLVLWPLFHYWSSTHYHATMRTLFDVEQQCSAEKEASQQMAEQLKVEKAAADALCQDLNSEREALTGLLGKVCDAIVRIENDGETVAHSDTHFENIVGCDMHGRSFSSLLSEFDCQRWRKAVAASSATSSVQLVPISLSSTRCTRAVDSEVFVVQRWDRTAESSKSGPSYLLGVRLTSEIVACATSDYTASVSTPSVFSGSAYSMGSSSVTGDQASECSDASTSCKRKGILKKSVKFEDSSHENTKDALRPNQRAMELKGPVFFPQPCISNRCFHGCPHPTFTESDSYLQHCLKGVLVDIIEAINCNVSACCAWHAAATYCYSLLREACAEHQCSDGFIEVLGQCPHCTCLMTSNTVGPTCWICGSEPELVSGGSDLTGQN
eukprot:TRINITY_DN50754_c0_g1_i1.p1 TRINITY_DN50754_c0_g1~~TRINITY_DN50754_c0_g1_i1.p1  ORF type:complete len:577 (-),score=49.81 TRINITY_DN50754_c0_g1_i1:347-1843(-)